jgi:hypothetical protein
MKRVAVGLRFSVSKEQSTLFAMRGILLDEMGVELFNHPPNIFLIRPFTK